MPPPIAIIGAGFGGLTLARILEVNDIDYMIFERNESPDELEEPSTAVDLLSNSGQLAVEAAGLLDKFKKVASFEDQTNVGFDHHGDIIMRTIEEDRARIDRKTLRELLIKSIPTGRFRWNAEVANVEREADGSISIHLVAGTIEGGHRLVVGADGTWSKVRSLVTSAKPKYAGLQYLQTTASSKSEIHATIVGQLYPSNYTAIAHGRQIAAQRSPDGSYTVWATLTVSEDWTDPDLTNASPFAKKLLEHEYSTWATKNKNWIKHSDGEFRAWPVYTMPAEALAWKPVPGITLVGDAAHVVPPMAGEGVDSAMFDSFKLGQEIIKHGVGGLCEAVSEYEKTMFSRAKALINRTSELQSLAFAKDAPRAIHDMMSAMAEQQRISNDDS